MMKKEKNGEAKDSYEFKAKEPEMSIEEQIDAKMQEWEKQDQTDDLHILDVAKNPPEPGYMKVELKKATIHTKDEDEEPIAVEALGMPLNENHRKPPNDPSIYVNCNGDSIQAYDTIFDVDLAMMAEAQVSDCASTIFPMLVDETVALALEEKKARTPEKRKEEFKWWWVLLLMMIIIPIILITITVFPSLMGG